MFDLPTVHDGPLPPAIRDVVTPPSKPAGVATGDHQDATVIPVVPTPTDSPDVPAIGRPARVTGSGVALPRDSGTPQPHCCGPDPVVDEFLTGDYGRPS